MSTPHKTNPRTSSSSRTPNDILLHSTRIGSITTKHQPQRQKTSSNRSIVKSTKLSSVFVNGREQEQLMKACGDGDIEKVRYLLTNTNPLLNPDLIRDTKLRSPLLIACASGHAEMVRLLVRFGADVNNPVGDIVGNRPMDLAVVANNFDTVLALLELGATVQRPGSNKSYLSSSQEGTNMDTGESKYKPPIPHRIGRTPLDLAQSRLDLLARNDQSSGHDVTAQVIKIIDLLKYFAKGASSIHNETTESTAIATISDPTQELDNLTAKLSSIALQENSREQEKGVIKDLSDVISRLQL